LAFLPNDALLSGHIHFFTAGYSRSRAIRCPLDRLIYKVARWV
jgi:hypothetical protein